MPASSARLAHMGSVSRNAKRPALRPGASLQSKAFCDLLRGLAVGDGDETLVRLEGLLREARIELAELGRLRDEALVGRLDEVGLDLDRLVERLGADELLDRRGRLLERLLGVIGGLDRDRLGALGDDAEALQSGVGVVLAELQHGVDLDHWYPLPAPQRRLLIAFARSCPPRKGNMCTAQ